LLHLDCKFGPKNKLESIYQININDEEFLSVDQLKKFIETRGHVLKDFEKAIGVEGSLNIPISLMKSALSYPTILPILLTGNKGTGKKYLVSLMKEYLINSGIWTNKSKLYSYDLSTISFDTCMDELEKIDRFAYTNLVYISSISSISTQEQNVLAELISKTKNTRIVLSSEENSVYLSPQLLFKLPVIANIPPLNGRSTDERKQFIAYFLKKEEEKLQKKIYLSHNLLSYLIDMDFAYNIKELSKTIITICANAYSGNNDMVKINLCNLPLDMVKNIPAIKKDSFIAVDQIMESSFCNKILETMTRLIELNKNDKKSFLSDYKKNMRGLYETLEEKELYTDKEFSTFEKLVAGILKNLEKNKDIHLPLNSIRIISRMLIMEENSKSSLIAWQRSKQDDLKDLFNNLKIELENEYVLEEKISDLINASLSKEVSLVTRIFILLNINYYNTTLRNQKMTGIVLCHGVSTASSIADAVNTLLECQVFEAVDMPLNTTVEEIAQRVNNFVKENSYLNDLVLLVDMGSLEKLDTLIENRINIGILNNISTASALNVGSMILRNMDMEEILKKASEDVTCHYRLILSRKYEKAIIFASDTGVSVSEKLVSLFKKSLPKKIDLVMSAYDYKNLKSNGSSDGIFEKYDVQLMISSKGIGIKEMPIITLEEVMSFEKIDVLRNVLSYYLDNKELDMFETSLLKNFTLESIVNNLTILNPTKLLDDVSFAVDELQRNLNIRLQSHTIIGISMHICFLIERLVIRNEMELCEDDSFKKNNLDFVEAVDNSFERIYKTYNVQIPTSEMVYLFEYIEND
ncbi:MAG: PRD domain-containing protein, partial [Erysipelotrichaceae bacterium]|nr:PRD domain-containing protein [Erysipelotrichaceae bacterium]